MKIIQVVFLFFVVSSGFAQNEFVRWQFKFEDGSSRFLSVYSRHHVEIGSVVVHDIFLIDLCEKVSIKNLAPTKVMTQGELLRVEAMMGPSQKVAFAMPAGLKPMQNLELSVRVKKGEQNYFQPGLKLFDRNHRVIGEDGFSYVPERAEFVGVEYDNATLNTGPKVDVIWVKNHPDPSLRHRFAAYETSVWQVQQPLFEKGIETALLAMDLPGYKTLGMYDLNQDKFFSTQRLAALFHPKATPTNGETYPNESSKNAKEPLVLTWVEREKLNAWALTNSNSEYFIAYQQAIVKNDVRKLKSLYNELFLKIKK